MERIISKHKGDKSWKTDLSIKDRARRRKMSKTCASKALCTKRSQASETCLWKGGITSPFRHKMACLGSSWAAQ